MASTDPDFEKKAADITGQYLNPPQHAAVFCADEKTAMWDVIVFTKNRDRLLEGAVATVFFEQVLAQARLSTCCRMNTSPSMAR